MEFEIEMQLFFISIIELPNFGTQVTKELWISMSQVLDETMDMGIKLVTKFEQQDDPTILLTKFWWYVY